MRYRNDWALACCALALTLSVAARADITSWAEGESYVGNGDVYYSKF
jgi:hypothetical protein